MFSLRLWLEISICVLVYFVFFPSLFWLFFLSRLLMCRGFEWDEYFSLLLFPCHVIVFILSIILCLNQYRYYHLSFCLPFVLQHVQSWIKGWRTLVHTGITWLDVVCAKLPCHYVADGRRERGWVRGIVGQSRYFALQDYAQFIWSACLYIIFSQCLEPYGHYHESRSMSSWFITTQVMWVNIM